MTVEGAVAITAAIVAGSVALLGFGLVSAIEGLASIIVIWRFTGKRRLSDHAERLVAVSFFLLAPYVAQATLRALIRAPHARRLLERALGELDADLLVLEQHSERVTDSAAWSSRHARACDCPGRPPARAARSPGAARGAKRRCDGGRADEVSEIGPILAKPRQAHAAQRLSGPQ
jgi:hypothetical protein